VSRTQTSDGVFPLGASRAADILNAARADNFTIARQKGEWQFVETLVLHQARPKIPDRNGVLAIMPKPFAAMNC
jgi:hypothetical protein